MVIEAEGLEAKDPNGITIFKTFTNLSTYCHVLVQFCLHVCIKSTIPSHCYAVVVRLFSLIPTIQYVAMTLASTLSSLIVLSLSVPRCVLHQRFHSLFLSNTVSLVFSNRSLSTFFLISFCFVLGVFFNNLSLNDGNK